METKPDRASEPRLLGDSRHASALRRRRLYAMSWVVLATVVALSMLTGYLAWQQAWHSARNAFVGRANAAAMAIGTRMMAYEDTVRAAAGVLEARADIDRASFTAFVEKLQVPQRQQGVHGLGFARLVRDDQRQAYVESQRALHGPEFDIHPAGRRDEYVVLELMHPDVPGLKPLLGRDLMADPIRRAAIEKARTTGALTEAVHVRLGDNTRGRTGIPGFLLYAPVYATLLPSDASAIDKHAHLRGLATAGFGWEQIIDEALKEIEPDLMDLALYLPGTQAGPVYERRSLRSRHGADMRPAFAHVAHTALFGQDWELHAQSPPLWVAVPRLLPILLLTLSGMLFGALLFALLRNLARAERRSRALLDAVADHLPALIAYIDRNDQYGFANRATRDWFGGQGGWSGRTLEDVHRERPDFVAALKQGMASCTPERGAAWETELGQPPRAVQVSLVPDVEKNEHIVGWYLMANDISEQRRAHHQTTLARDHLQRITDKLPALISQYDREERLLFCNRAALEVVQWATPYRAHQPLIEIMGAEQYARRKPHIDSALSGRDVDFEASMPGTDGSLRRMRCYFTPDVDADGRVLGFFSMLIDITDKARLETALYNANERAQVTLSAISEAVVTTDVAQCITYMNPAAETLSGWPLHSALQQPMDEVLPLTQVDDSHQDDDAAAAMPGDIQLIRRDGRRMLVEVTSTPLHGRDERRIGSVLVLRDITEARALGARMAYLAHHDTLTGLPNRLQLNETLGGLISSATNRGNGVAVLFLDLDLFKHVNDALGHHTGDQLLQQVAKRIQHNVGSLGSVYRTGGDEFVVLLDNVVTRDGVLQLADRLLAIGGTPYTVGSHELHQAFSIGISLFPEDGYDAGTLMMRADAAMYLAKRSGRNATRFYTRELATSVDARIELENSLRRSLRNGDLCLHYQPQIDRHTGRIVGIEGLARWQRGDRMMMPGDFLPIAEETNLIVDIDQWAIHAACRQNRIWQQAGLPPVRISVNIAAANFDTDRLLDTVKSALDDSGMAPEFLELEVTETTLMRDVQRTDHTLRALKAIGVRIAIDDFGTGFSSLSYLGNYGFNILKIDQSFVRDVTEPSQAAITRAIIGLANQLHCRTIAEGVETLEQAAWLAHHGCDEMQGNLFSPPLPASELVRLLARNTSWDIPRPADSAVAHWS